MISNRSTRPDQEEGLKTSYTELLGCLSPFCEAIPQISVFQLVAADLD